MSDLIEKISSYNLFNYLLPGSVFVFLLDSTANISIVNRDLFIGFFVYYFLGMVISRVGSLLVEPFLKWIKFVRFSDYSEFVNAEQKDQKLSQLSEINNVYRTIVSMLLIFALALCVESLIENGIISTYAASWFVGTSLLVLFLGAYRKQTKYLNKRIEASQAE